jgi:predicted RNA-binding Zn-ribbon protein involved in translation (DUF1610 family)
MAKKKGEKGINKKSKTSSANHGVTLQQNESTVFYRCACPECGEDALELYGRDVFFRSEFLGVTNDGEFGCGNLGLDGDYHWVIECSSCGHVAFDTDMLPTETLLDWAAAHGKVIKELEFTCPVCGSADLLRTERGNRSVRAVYEVAENSKTKGRAEVALSFEHVMEGGKSVRYCCLEGHELAKQDRSPVGTLEELVEWLKALQPSGKR